METLNLIYAIKILLGAVTAALCFVLGVNNILAAVGIYVITYLFVWVLLYTLQQSLITA